ncbi:unnamed protein product [Blepharisma stoltei]|uniref:Uncharacterized protein n=1 Tax=Blepharisma stoltei TaxID=1481888 RepID=A0AAU9IJR8_9CILI|nr:unnamed protein product [Blepharisma stoltei]
MSLVIIINMEHDLNFSVKYSQKLTSGLFNDDKAAKVLSELTHLESDYKTYTETLRYSATLHCGFPNKNPESYLVKYIVKNSA